MFKPTKKQHVVNKAYVDQNGGSGGADGLEVVFTFEEDEYEGNWVCNRTYEEVVSALQSGMVINAHVFSNDSNGTVQYTCNKVGKGAAMDEVSFSTITNSEGAASEYIFTLYNDGRIGNTMSPLA